MSDREKLLAWCLITASVFCSIWHVTSVIADHVRRTDDLDMACIPAKGTVVNDNCIHPMLVE